MKTQQRSLSWEKRVGDESTRVTERNEEEPHRYRLGAWQREGLII